MKKAVFGLQENRGPWTFKKTRKTRFRDIFTFRVFGIFDHSPLTGPKNKKGPKEKQIFTAIKKKLASPPLAPGARGGDPPFRAQPGIKSTPKIAIAAEKKRE